MNEVHVANNDRDLLREVAPRKFHKEPRAYKSPVHIGHAGLNVFPKLELLRALADFDRAKLAGPFIDILEQMAMNGLESARSKSPSGTPSLLRWTTMPRSI
jgi:hypothetical protein